LGHLGQTDLVISSEQHDQSRRFDLSEEGRHIEEWGAASRHDVARVRPLPRPFIVSAAL